MSSLSAFLNPIKPENQKVVVSKRFIDPDTNEPVAWEVKCITPKEYKEIKKGCTRKAPVPGKKGAYLPEVDTDAMLNKIAVACTVYPNLDDAELQDGYGVMGADQLLMSMLLPGEYDDYITIVTEINGYDISMDEKVDEAKN